MLAREHRFDVPRLRRPRYLPASAPYIAADTAAAASAAAPTARPAHTSKSGVSHGKGPVFEAADRPGTAAAYRVSARLRCVSAYGRWEDENWRGIHNNTMLSIGR